MEKVSETAGDNRNWRRRLLSAGTLGASVMALGPVLNPADSRASVLTPPEAQPVNLQLERELTGISDTMQKSIDEKIPGFYQEKVKYHGQKAIRIVASYGDINQYSGEMSYTHIVEYIRPNQRIPLSISRYVGVSHSKYRPGENFDFLTKIEKSGKDSGKYKLISSYKDSNNNLQTDYYLANGQNNTLSQHNNATRQSKSSRYMSMIFNNVTADIKSLIDFAAQQNQAKNPLVS